MNSEPTSDLNSGRNQPRSEDDLRAAFQLAAQDAPLAQDVLSGLKTDHSAGAIGITGVPATRRRAVLRWAPIAAAVVVLGIALPLYAVNNTGHNDKRSSSADSSIGAVGAKVPAAAGSAASVSGGGSTGSTGTTNGEGHVAPGVVPPPSNYAPTGTLCTPTQVSLTLTWKSEGSDLSGSLTAVNTSAAPCDLLVKPAVTVLNSAGQPLGVPQLNSEEQAVGPSRLLPGASTSAGVLWRYWCGTVIHTSAQVSWGTGDATASVTTQGVRAAACNHPDGADVSTASITTQFFSPLS